MWCSHNIIFALFLSVKEAEKNNDEKKHPTTEHNALIHICRQDHGNHNVLLYMQQLSIMAKFVVCNKKHGHHSISYSMSKSTGFCNLNPGSHNVLLYMQQRNMMAKSVIRLMVATSFATISQCSVIRNLCTQQLNTMFLCVTTNTMCSFRCSSWSQWPLILQPGWCKCSNC